MVRKHATPALLAMADRIYRRRWRDHLSSGDKRDAMLCRLAEELIVRQRPNLLMIHYVETDKTQHRHGPHSSQARAALERVDDLIKRLRDAVNRAGLSEKTAWLLVGDHGFADVEYALAPNILLAEHGFLHLVNGRVDVWKAIVVNSGGSAGVYFHDPSDLKTVRSVRALLEAKSSDADGRAYYRIIERAELNDLGAAPGASFYLEGEPGYMFVSALTGPFLRRSSLRGQHGYLPSRPAMHTGFIAAGAGVKKGGVIDDMHLIDVAPTVAALLGVPMPRADGRVLREIIQ